MTGLVVQMEAVAAISELVRDSQDVGEGRAFSKCHCPLQMEGAKNNYRGVKMETLSDKNTTLINLFIYEKIFRCREFL